MKRWEYYIHRLLLASVSPGEFDPDSLAALHRYGTDGWELVAVLVDGTAVFKRAIEEWKTI